MKKYFFWVIVFLIVICGGVAAYIVLYDEPREVSVYRPSELKGENNSVLYEDTTPLQVEIDDEVEKASLRVEGDMVYMNGTITTTTFAHFKKVFAKHPEIRTLVMEQVPGSIDDEVSLQLATWLSKKDLTFMLRANSEIASGGTDLFLAGKTRSIERGAKIGVHSWADESGKSATDYPDSDPVHQQYIEYYMAIGWSEQAAREFYRFTNTSAPADGMHWMTEEELVRFGVTTEAGLR